MDDGLVAADRQAR